MSRDEKMKREQEMDAASATIRSLKTALERQDAFLRQMGQASHGIGTILEIHDDRVVVARGGETFNVARPMDKLMEPGDQCLLVLQTMQIFDVVSNERSATTGAVTTVSSVIDDLTCQVTINGEDRVVRNNGFEVEKGDRVLVDYGTRTTILRNLGKAKDDHSRLQIPDVSWDDIGGNEAAKAALREAIEIPHMNRSLFAKYGKKPIKGVLLSGDPGNGKTMLGKAACRSLAATHGKESAAGFLYVKGPELLSKWVGESEAAIRGLFTTARQHHAEHGYPALIFIDEADALLGRRGSRHGGMEHTIVPQFLSEMDGLDDSHAVVLLATNRADALDPAVVRDGRIDRRVHVERPDRDTAAAIFKIHMRNTPSQDPVEALAAGAVAGLYDSNLRVGVRQVALRDAVSGAMIAGVVDRASTRALMRDVETKRKTASGVCLEDVKNAILDTHTSLCHVEVAGGN